MRKRVKASLTWELALPHLFSCLEHVSNSSLNGRKIIHSWKNPAGQSGACFDGFALFWGGFLVFLQPFLSLTSPFLGRRDLWVLDAAQSLGIC